MHDESVAARRLDDGRNGRSVAVRDEEIAEQRLRHDLLGRVHVVIGNKAGVIGGEQATRSLGAAGVAIVMIARDGQELGWRGDPAHAGFAHRDQDCRIRTDDAVHLIKRRRPRVCDDGCFVDVIDQAFDRSHCRRASPPSGQAQFRFTRGNYFLFFMQCRRTLSPWEPPGNQFCGANRPSSHVTSARNNVRAAALRREHWRPARHPC